MADVDPRTFLDFIGYAEALTRDPMSVVITFDPETGTYGASQPLPNEVALAAADRIRRGMLRDDPELANVQVHVAEFTEYDINRTD